MIILEIDVFDRVDSKRFFACEFDLHWINRTGIKQNAKYLVCIWLIYVLICVIDRQNLIS